MTSPAKPSQKSLQDQLTISKIHVQDIEQKISILNSNIYQLSQKFYTTAAGLQRKIDSVQFSRPRGNPANQWPHCPMTNRVRAFYQIKEHKERELRKKKDLLRQVVDHDTAILTSQRLVLENELFDVESQIRLILIQLNCV